MELDIVSQAYVAGQNTHFREMVKGWALDADISNEEFSKLVSGLDFDMAMERMEFLGKMAFKDRVDTAQRGQLELASKRRETKDGSGNG